LQNTIKMKTIQITSGRGPAECCWVVAQVLKYFIQELANHKLSYEVLHREKGPENSTLQSATLLVKGHNLEGFLENWLGTIQWVGTSNYRKFNKHKNWFIGVFELENIVALKLDEAQVKYQAIRGSGPGGQHANKTSSAIRAIHKPTGIQVLAMDSRSQHQNKKIALKRLQESVALHNIEQLKVNVQHQWKNHFNLKRGNPVRVFKGNDFNVQKKQKTYTSKRQQLKRELKHKLWEH